MVALHIKMIYNTEVIKEIHLSKRDETMDSGDSRSMDTGIQKLHPRNDIRLSENRLFLMHKF